MVVFYDKRYIINVQQPLKKFDFSLVIILRKFIVYRNLFTFNLILIKIYISFLLLKNRKKVAESDLYMVNYTIPK